jgi:LPXTG-motif cell wall-anchored protein
MRNKVLAADCADFQERQKPDMAFALWLLQATPDTGSDNSTMIRVGAGVLALVIVAVILVRRKKKASKEDWS